MRKLLSGGCWGTELSHLGQQRQNTSRVPRATQSGKPFDQFGKEELSVAEKISPNNNRGCHAAIWRKVSVVR